MNMCLKWFKNKLTRSLEPNKVIFVKSVKYNNFLPTLEIFVAKKILAGIESDVIYIYLKYGKHSDILLEDLQIWWNGSFFFPLATHSLF